MSLDHFELVRGRATARLSAQELRERAAAAARIVVDVGAGDGRLTYALARAHPDWLCVAIDACAEAMRRLSFTAARKPARGGASNALFLRSAAEDLPGALEGLAHELTVHYPWGSLLRAVVDPNPEVLGRIARLGRPGGRLRILVNASAVPGLFASLRATGSPTAGVTSDGEVARTKLWLDRGYGEAGIRLESCRPEVAPANTSWGARLHGGRAATVLAIEGVVAGGAAEARSPLGLRFPEANSPGPRQQPRTAGNLHERLEKRGAAAVARTLEKTGERSYAMLFQHLRNAARTLLRSPGFSAATLATLALAIGANTALFTLVNAILLRPIPGMGKAAGLVNVHARQIDDGGELGGFSYPDYLDYRDRTRTLAGLAAFNGRGMSFDSGEGRELVGAQLVSGNYFALMDVRPQLGRLLGEQDERGPGASPVAVVSHSFWQHKLGGDSSAVGRTIRLNGFPFTVVGVASPGFVGHFIGFPFAVWVPVTMAGQAAPSEDLGARDQTWLELVGRVAPGATLAEARADLTAVAAGLASEYPETHKGHGVDVNRLTGIDDDLRRSVVTFLALLQTVALLVLVIACVNVAGMLLARSAGRRREVAIRRAIGADRSHLVAQFLAEALLLFGTAGVLGTLLAAWSADALMAFQPRSPLPLELDLGLDLRVLAFTTFVTLATGVFFGLTPVRDALRVDVVGALKSGADAVRSSRLRQLFVVGQVALSLLLLVGAGLFLRALGRARSLDPGFSADQVQMASTNVSILARDEARGRAFYQQLLENVRALPGVESASLARHVPLSLGSLTTRVQAEGVESPNETGVAIDWNAVTPGYFGTMRIPLLQGRDFLPGDRTHAPTVGIASEALARRFWPGRDPIGRRLRRGATEIEIVGVARDSVYRRLGEAARPHLYLPAEQSYAPGMAVLVRTAGDPSAVMPSLREAIRRLDPELPILNEMGLSEYIGRSLAPQRMAGTVAGILGALGLVIAAAGIYGVVAYFVGQRTREIGLRMAVGADRAAVLRLVLGEGLRLALLGVGVGLLAALGTTRLIAGFLPGVSPTDPPTLALVALLMTLTALLASAGPALRAARLDPAVALKEG